LSNLRDNIESAIWKELESKQLSASHDQFHIRRVLTYALGLSSIYQGDDSVITAAAMLHDLGRNDATLHGPPSRLKSVTDAQIILSSIGELSDEQIEKTLLAINEHDQPGLRPSTIEGRILKDADFLAGFGAWGILRTAIWSTESKYAVETDNVSSGQTDDLKIDVMKEFLIRLDEKMPARKAGLEFPESRSVAKKLHPITRYFRGELDKKPQLSLMRRRGIYIIFVGISGSGKDTQAEQLQLKLYELGMATHFVQEPTPFYKDARHAWSSYKKEPWWQAFLLMADRYKLMRTEVEPALSRGETVLSVRSYFSSMAIQGHGTSESALIELMHHFVPVVDVVFLLDLPAEEARRRCVNRAEVDGRILGDHESLKILEATRKEYLQIASSHSSEDFVVLDGTRPLDEIHEMVIKEMVARYPFHESGKDDGHSWLDRDLGNDG
jgi:dTMP kinase